MEPISLTAILVAAISGIASYSVAVKQSKHETRKLWAAREESIYSHYNRLIDQLQEQVVSAQAQIVSLREAYKISEERFQEYKHDKEAAVDRLREKCEMGERMVSDMAHEIKGLRHELYKKDEIIAELQNYLMTLTEGNPICLSPNVNRRDETV